MKLFKLVLAAGLILGSTQCLAWTYAGDLSVHRVRLINNEVMFGVSPQPAATCSNYGEHLFFSLQTEEDYALYSTLLTAKASGAKIDIWFEESSAPGTNHTNGCHADSIAEVNGIAIR